MPFARPLPDQLAGFQGASDNHPAPDLHFRDPHLCRQPKKSKARTLRLHRLAGGPFLIATKDMLMSGTGHWLPR